MNQQEKKRFRDSSNWKKFRKHCKERDKVDYITQKSLLKGFNLHHLDLNDEHYKDITDETKFICLNKQTHESLHWLYRYYHTGPTILDRIKFLLDKMKGYEN